MDQGEFYNKQYDDSSYTEEGLPDYKIIDYRQKTHGKKILSLGCGMGADLWFLTANNDVWGVDSSEVAVSIAKRHKIRAIKADLQNKIPIYTTFDIVILKDILEHVLDPLQLLSEAKRLSRKKGEILISIPNHFYWWFRLRLLLGKNLIWKSVQHDHTREQEEWNYMHIRFFTYKGLLKMLGVVGLKVVKGYWDFGTLAHYSDPEMFHKALYTKREKSALAKTFVYIIYPIYQVFNFFMPKKIRSLIVSLNPSLLCAGFYLRLKKI